MDVADVLLCAEADGAAAAAAAAAEDSFHVLRRLAARMATCGQVEALESEQRGRRRKNPSV